MLNVSCSAPREPTKSVREMESQKASEAAQKVDFSAGNAEIANISSRQKLVAQPDLLGYIVLLNFGQPVAYYQIKGKVTSSGKRLESPTGYSTRDCGEFYCEQEGPMPSYDGTYGDSDKYVYFWTINGQYVQWSGDYLYSDKPLELNTKSAAVVLK